MNAPAASAESASSQKIQRTSNALLSERRW